MCDDRKAYETLQQLLPICRQFYPKPTDYRSAVAELRSTIKCFRAQLRRVSNRGGYRDKYRFQLALKVKQALNSMGNLTLNYDYDYSRNGDDCIIWITVEGKRKRKLFALESGFKILFSDNEAFAYATKVKLTTEHGTIYQAVVIHRDGTEDKQLAYRCKNRETTYFMPVGSNLDAARERMAEKFTDIFMSRAELAFA